MSNKEALLEERERLQKEHLKLHVIRMDALNKLNALLPEFHKKPDGTQMAEHIFTKESITKYQKAVEEEREASEKCKAIFGKILEINEKLSKL